MAVMGSGEQHSASSYMGDMSAYNMSANMGSNMTTGMNTMLC